MATEFSRVKFYAVRMACDSQVLFRPIRLGSRSLKVNTRLILEIQRCSMLIASF